MGADQPSSSPAVRVDDKPPVVRTDDKPPVVHTDDKPPAVRMDDKPPIVRTDDKPDIMCSMVARPLSELPAELRPRRAEPATAEGDYDVLHYLR